MNLAPHMRPPICLRYAMWCLACSITEKYFGLQEHFYIRARKYAEIDEMKGHGESMITIAHAQCWLLQSSYEFKMMYFPRAWMSTGRAVRLVQMMGLHRLDGVGLDVKQSLPPPRDWTEREERRRTFWMAFAEDRYASIGTGWPMSIDEKDVSDFISSPSILHFGMTYIPPPLPFFASLCLLRNGLLLYISLSYSPSAQEERISHTMPFFIFSFWAMR